MQHRLVLLFLLILISATILLNIPSVASPSLSPSIIRHYQVTTPSGLNMRGGPGIEYARLGALTYQSIVEIISIHNYWGRLNYQGLDAYIYLGYASEIPLR